MKAPSLLPGLSTIRRANARINTKAALNARIEELIRMTDNLFARNQALMAVLSLARPYAADLSVVSVDGVMTRPTIAKLIDSTLAANDSLKGEPNAYLLAAMTERILLTFPARPTDATTLDGITAYADACEDWADQITGERHVGRE